MFVDDILFEQAEDWLFVPIDVRCSSDDGVRCGARFFSGWHQRLVVKRRLRQLVPIEVASKEVVVKNCGTIHPRLVATQYVVLEEF